MKNAWLTERLKKQIVQPNVGGVYERKKSVHQTFKTTGNSASDRLRGNSNIYFDALLEGDIDLEPVKDTPLVSRFRSGLKGAKSYVSLNPDAFEIDVFELMGGALVHGGSYFASQIAKHADRTQKGIGQYVPRWRSKSGKWSIRPKGSKPFSRGASASLRKSSNKTRNSTNSWISNINKNTALSSRRW